MTITQARAKYTGKRIKLTGHITRYGVCTVGGMCDWIGINPHLPNKGVEVVIDRTPYWNVDLKQISLI